MAAIFLTKGTFVGPVGQVLWTVDIHFLTSSKNQVPFLNFRIPKHLRVTEIFFGAYQHGIGLILLECYTVVCRYCHRLHLTLSCRGVEGHYTVVLLINHTRTAENLPQGIGFNCGGLRFPVNEVTRCRVSPCHILPHRAVGVPLIIQMIYPVFIEHTIGVVHPSVSRSMVIRGAVRFTVLRVKRVAQLHLFPAEKVFHCSSKTTVTMECDIQ